MDSNTLGVAEVCEEANQHVVVDVAAAAGGDFAIDRSDGGVCSACHGVPAEGETVVEGYPL